MNNLEVKKIKPQRSFTTGVDGFIARLAVFTVAGHSQWKTYILALLAPAAILFARLALGFNAGDDPALVLFFIPIILCAYLGGLRPGLLATALAAIGSTYYLVQPLHRLSITSELHFVQWIVLIAGGVLFSLLAESMYQVQERRQSLETSLKATSAEHKPIEELNLFLSSIVESTNDAIIGKTLEGIITSWNHGAECLYGYKAEEIIGQSISIIIPPESPEELGEILTRIKNGERIKQLETVRVRKDGSKLHVVLTITPIKNGENELIGASVIAHDISEQKRLEKVLQDRKQRISSIADNIPHPISRLDKDLRFQFANQALGIWFNRSVENIIGHPLEEILGAEVFAGIKPNIELMLKGEPTTFENNIQNSMGEVFYGQMTLVPERSMGKDVDGMVMLVTDITERKIAENILRESEENFRALLEATTQTVWTLDPDGESQDDPQWWMDLTGQSAEEVARLGWLERVHPEDREQARAAWVDALTNQSFIRFEYRLLTKDNKYRNFVVNGVPLFHQDGSLRQWIGTFDDVTEIRLAEQALRESEELKSSVLNSMLAHIAVLDKEGSIIAVNEAWQRFARENTNDPAALVKVDVGSNYLETCQQSASQVSEDANIVWQGIKGVLDREKQDFIFEYSCHSPYEERWFTLSATPLLTQSGGAVISHTNITKRKQAEEALRRNRAQIEAVFQAIHDGIIVTDMEGNVLLLNDAVARISGFPVAEDLKKDLAYFEEIFELFYLDGRKLTTEEGPLSRILRGESLSDYELRARRRDNGYERFFSYSGEPVYDEQGKQILAVVVTRDITMRKHSEAALEKERERLKNIATASPSVIYSFKVSPQGKTSYPYVSPAFVDLYGVRPEEVMEDAHITDSRVHPQDFQELTRSIARSARTMSRWHHVWRVNHPLKGEIWVEGFSAPALESDGSIIWHGILNEVTERKRAEAALRESDERLKLALRASGIGVWEWDMRNNTVFWSPKCYEIAGVEHFGNPQEDVKNLTHPEDLKRVMKALQTAIDEKKVFEEEFRIIRSDGEIRWIQNLAKANYDDGDKPFRVVGTIQDITERKRAEFEKAELNEQLETERQRLNNIVANVPGIVWEELRKPDAVERHTNFVSNYLENMLGYTAQEWHQTPGFWLSTIHPDDRARMTQIVATPFTVGKNRRTQVRFIAKDGRVVWTETHTVNIVNDAGEAVGLRGVTIDISEQKRAEDAIRKAEEKYRGIFENAIEGLFQATREGNLISVNPALVRILGYDSPEDLMACRNLKVQHYVDPNSGFELEQMLAQKDIVIGFKSEIYRKDMSRIWSVENIRTIRDEDGEIIYYEGSIENITERKALEEQLRQSQKMEAIGRLAGGIAHDFNNLLTAINGYSELTLMELYAESPLRSNLEQIKKAGDRAASLTRQLLAFSRKQVLQPRILDLKLLISELEKMLIRLIGEDIYLQTILDPKLGSIKADPGQIEQVVMNLVVNARDAMPQGGKLTIEAVNTYLDETFVEQHMTATATAYVRLTVRDTGIGMDEQTQERIFEPFFTTKEIGKGTGLGLSTVYGIITQSGGRLSVYSGLGKGTTFKIYLPQVGEETHEYKRQSEVEEILQGKETILLVEDEEAVRKLAVRVLEMYGYKVLEAESGEKALDLCASYAECIDLLLTDVVMPGMSGRELTDTLKPQRKGIKVLFMSGYTDNEIIGEDLLTQEEMFIHKPFTPNTLAQKVREALDKEMQ